MAITRPEHGVSFSLRMRMRFAMRTVVNDRVCVNHALSLSVFAAASVSHLLNNVTITLAKRAT